MAQARLIKFASIEDEKTIRVLVGPHARFDEIKILNHQGKILNSYEIKHEKNQVLFKFPLKLSLLKNYQVILRDEKVWAYPSLKLLNDKFVTTKPLGSKIEGNELSVSLWSPTATEVNFLLFDKDAKTLLGKRSLKLTNNGVWYQNFREDEFKIHNFDGLFYQYEVTAFGQIRLALDPYAKSMAAFDPHSEDRVGKAAIVSVDTPSIKPPSKVAMANATDFVAYEAHVHDFTIDPNLNIKPDLKGSYRGFTKIIPHLKDLGITHVQFMPLQNFFTATEKDRSYQGTEVSKKKVNYNWGYDPQSYFSPDGWYSQNAQNPHERIKEVKDLFSALHENGIGVVLDVVYNHLYEKSILDNAAPGCYLRINEQGEVSTATGAGVTLESRNLMARRLIIDSLKFWQNYYGADGFRFDLMGFIDQETMKEIRKALGSDAILYGEAWNFTDLPFNEATTKTNFPHEVGLSVFNDSARDSYAGRNEAKGFAQGVFTEAPKVKAGIIGSLKNFPDPHGEIIENDYDRFAKEPSETLNYLAIHDGFTLWDKINLSYGENKNEREKIVRLALGMLFTSQGRIVIHGGDEFGRSKPLAPNDPNPDRAHTSNIVDPENGISFFHENSYASPDSTNMVDWNRGAEFFELKNYVKGLVELRRVTPGLRYQSATSIKKGLQFLGKRKTKTKEQTFIAYLIDNTLENSVVKGFTKSPYKNILVIHNADTKEVTLKVPGIKKPEMWNVLVDDESAGTIPLKNSKVQVINGEVKIPRKSTVVLGGME